MLRRSWWLVKPQTINNCFKKAGFYKRQSVDDGDYEAAISEISIEEVPAPEGMDPAVFSDIVTCDDNEECYGEHSDDAICAEVLSEMAGEDCSSDSDLEIVANESASTSTKRTSSSEVIALRTTTAIFRMPNVTLLPVS